MILDQILSIYSYFFQISHVKSPTLHLFLVVLKIYLFLMSLSFLFIAYGLNLSTDSIFTSIAVFFTILILMFPFAVDLFKKVKITKNNNSFLQKCQIYLVTIVVISTFFLIIARKSDELTSTDSALYMLSALVQSEAAIMAIVVTLSLVAIQHLSTTYSTRVIEFFKDWKTNPDLYILLFTYMLSIIFGLFVIKQIEASSL
ncbi:membrane-associated HD superfamily phosphohydrolase [Methanohalophilus levihalophilus]|nr:membrane-associated HD superfamily phosphohydrolase [Methanohalophilus levihalophilus]